VGYGGCDMGDNFILEILGREVKYIYFNGASVNLTEAIVQGLAKPETHPSFGAPGIYVWLCRAKPPSGHDHAPPRLFRAAASMQHNHQ